MEFDMTKVVEKIAMQAKENQEEFIFETIRPYCENILQIKINKEELKQILLNGMQKQQPCEGMRDATEEERKSTKDYIDSISKSTGLQFDDTYEELDFIQPHKKISVNLQSCEDCISRTEAKKLIQGKIDDIPKNKNGTYDSMFGQYVNGLYCAKTAISYMPSVGSRTKSGEWRKEWLTDSMTGRDGIYRVCSECGYEEDYYSGRKVLDYCPRCGSRNKEGVDE